MEKYLRLSLTAGSNDSELDLPNLQRDLDTQSQAILDGQKETVQARKMLAEQTKGLPPWRMKKPTFLEFRKASDEEKLIQFKTLYKGTILYHPYNARSSISKRNR